MTKAGARFFTQWTFWRNTLAITVALFVGWMLGALQVKPFADVNMAQNRQLKQQSKSLQAQLAEYKILEQIQQEAIAELRAANQALQDKLTQLEQELQHYRDVLEKRH